MIMPATNQPDDDQRHLRPKKERVIQPLQSNRLNPLPPIDQDHEDLLAELRAKTAALASQVEGKESKQHRVLEIEQQDADIIEALKEDAPSSNTVKTASVQQPSANANPAVELVREKLSRLYQKEPDARIEAIESYEAGTRRSKHQQYMYELTTSGKSLAEIQTAWHRYYVALPNDEKHQVWKEFYETQNAVSAFSQHASVKPKEARASQKSDKRAQSPLKKHPLNPSKPADQRTVSDIKSQLLDKVSAGGTLTAVHHVKSLLFGLGLAAFVGLIITFTFFNEVFVAPFISPSRSVSATPIIGDQSGPVGPEPKIIIPKINLEVPVVYGLGTVEENAIQDALEDGVVHYAASPNPGETGNSVIVGHSSNNILNSGRYKFAFVLLNRLEADDTFFVHRDGIRYTYKVYKKEVVAPTDISVLGTQEKPNTMTLITCDPPGTSINRLIITAEQISPDPAGNKPSTAIEVSTATEQLPSNAPSLWSRLWPF